MVKKLATNHYEIFGTNSNLPAGDIIKDANAWVFWPSVYRKSLDLETTGEIFNLLQELEG